jgi:DNA ligase (NAD+)
VVKRGEIIPKIIGKAPEAEQPPAAELSPITLPESCDTCHTHLVNDGTRLYCPNPACPKKLLHRLKKWVAVLDIRELGEKLIEALFASGRVTQIHELYTLTEAELTPYFLDAESLAKNKTSKGAAKVLSSIMMKRQLSLSQFTAGFDFEGVAENIMELVTAAGFNTLEKLRAAKPEDLAAVYETKKGARTCIAGVSGIGEITAQVIVEGMRECAAEMDAVLKAGVISIAPPVTGALPLSGLSF